MRHIYDFQCHNDAIIVCHLARITFETIFSWYVEKRRDVTTYRNKCSHRTISMDISKTPTVVFYRFWCFGEVPVYTAATTDYSSAPRDLNLAGVLKLTLSRQTHGRQPIPRPSPLPLWCFHGLLLRSVTFDRLSVRVNSPLLLLIWSSWSLILLDN